MPIELKQRRKELMKIYWYLGFPFYSSTILRCPLIILFLLFLTITYPPTCTIFLSTHPHPQKKSFYFLPYFQVPASKWFPPKYSHHWKMGFWKSYSQERRSDGNLKGAEGETNEMKIQTWANAMKARRPSMQARATLRMIKSTVKQFQFSVIDYNDPLHLTKMLRSFGWRNPERERKRDWAETKDTETDRFVSSYRTM